MSASDNFRFPSFKQFFSKRNLLILLFLLLSIDRAISLFPRKTVTIGYPIIEGFQDINEDGDYFGYNHEVIQLIAKRNNWKVTYVVDTFDNLYEKVKIGEIDVLGGVNESDYHMRREVSFAQYANGSDRSVIISRSIQSYVNNYGTLNHKKIGFLRNSRSYHELEQIFNRLSFDFSPVFFDTYEKLMQALNIGLLDAASFPSQYAFDSSLLIAQHNLKNHYFVTSKNNTAIHSELNRALSWIHARTPEIFNELQVHFYENRFEDSFVSRKKQQQNEVLRVLSIIIISSILVGIIIHFTSMSKKVRDIRRTWLKAIRNDELKVNFTPIARYRDHQIVMYSMQYYWDSKQFGILSKDEFLFIKGNELKTISRIHEFRVILRSIHLLRTKDTHKETKFILQMHSSYASWWAITQLKWILNILLWIYQVPPEVLIFSFSSTIVHDKKTKYSVASACEKMGISFLMNDFGLQFSSLSQIKQINYSLFKVDRIYTLDFHQNDVSLQIIKLIVNIAASLNKEVIIDGIDSLDLYERAESLNCHYMQGSLVGETMTLSEAMGIETSVRGDRNGG